jgi:hypothetical protein
MRRRGWWWRSVVGILLLAGAVGGCGGDDHDDGHDDGAACVLFGEVEPNATPLTAQFLGDLFVDDCVIVDGSLFDPVDVDSYRVVVQETLTLVVTLDHSPFVDFDVQLFEAATGQLILECGSNVVPEGCAVTLAVHGFDIAVDVVVSSIIGAGTYTLTLEAQ